MTDNSIIKPAIEEMVNVLEVFEEKLNRYQEYIEREVEDTSFEKLDEVVLEFQRQLLTVRETCRELRQAKLEEDKIDKNAILLKEQMDTKNRDDPCGSFGAR